MASHLALAVTRAARCVSSSSQMSSSSSSSKGWMRSLQQASNRAALGCGQEQPRSYTGARRGSAARAAGRTGPGRHGAALPPTTAQPARRPPHPPHARSRALTLSSSASMLKSISAIRSKGALWRQGRD